MEQIIILDFGSQYTQVIARRIREKAGSTLDSKLIRYDELDQSDIQFLCAQRSVDWQSVSDSVRARPSPFNDDAQVRENLANLRRDMAIWRGTA